ncbi:hypothetical protein Dimus_038726 [Dionaea muscipula]
MEMMHAEEDWVVSMVECYEIFELVDAGKLLEFFKIGVVAHKRHAIKMGKRPEGEESEKGDDGDDDDDQGGDDPAAPHVQPQPQPPATTNEPVQEEPEAEIEAEKDGEAAEEEEMVKESDEIPKDDVPEEPSREEDEDEANDVDIEVSINDEVAEEDVIRETAVEEVLEALVEEPAENLCRDLMVHPEAAVGNFDQEQLRQIFQAILHSMEE